MANNTLQTLLPIFTGALAPQFSEFLGGQGINIAPETLQNIGTSFADYGQLDALTESIDQATGQMNQSYDEAGRIQQETYDTSLAQLNQMFGLGLDTMTGTYAQGRQDITGWGQQGLDIARGAYEQGLGMLQPWQQAGQRATQGYLGYLQDPSQVSRLPGYEWQRQQGQAALEASAAARGGLFSGQTGADLVQYGTDYATTKIDESLNRWKPLMEAGLSASTTGAQLAGTYGTTAGQIAGDIGTGLSTLGGQYARGVAEMTGQQGRSLAELTTGFGENMANIAIGRGDFLSNAILAQGQATGNFYNAIGQTWGAGPEAGTGATPTGGTTPSVDPEEAADAVEDIVNTLVPTGAAIGGAAAMGTILPETGLAGVGLGSMASTPLAAGISGGTGAAAMFPGGEAAAIGAEGLGINAAADATGFGTIGTGSTAGTGTAGGAWGLGPSLALGAAILGGLKLISGSGTGGWKTKVGKLFEGKNETQVAESIDKLLTGKVWGSGTRNAEGQFERMEPDNANVVAELLAGGAIQDDDPRLADFISRYESQSNGPGSFDNLRRETLAYQGISAEDRQWMLRVKQQMDQNADDPDTRGQIWGGGQTLQKFWQLQEQLIEANPTYEPFAIIDGRMQ